MRTSVFRSRFGWLAPLATVCMLGCPKQELAPLGPCTVSAVREDVSETGISKVDLLFVIDNSLSMATEQKNLIDQLPRLITILTTGDKDPGAAAVDPNSTEGKARYFKPVSSLHLGVITTELAVMTNNSANGSLLRSCLSQHVDPATNRMVPNDDAILQTSVAVATTGQTAPRGTPDGIAEGSSLIAPRPACADAEPEMDYLVFETEGKMPDELAEGAASTALSFGCIATVGVLGCAWEQQLEATWKALAPSNGEADFLDGTSGHGDPTGDNAGFLRSDAILATIIVTDEEDCSITEEGRVLFDTPEGSAGGSNPWAAVKQNLRCGEADRMKRTDLIHDVKRYVDGLRSLKPENPDLIIFAGLIGIPEEAEQMIVDGDFDEVLAMQNMQFRTNTPTDVFPQPVCTVVRTPGGPREAAYPGRRIVETARGFGANAALFSICRTNYQPAVDSIIERIASKLKGNCLPRQLTPDESGLVRCEVYELLAPDAAQTCNSEKHLGSVERRTVIQDGDRVQRNACRMRQVPTGPSGLLNANLQGWYYDSFSEELKAECLPGEQQRIVFTDRAQLSPGSGATFECFQPVQSITANALGFDAINTRCDEDADICADRSNKDEGGYDLICIEELRTCQVECSSDPDCPPGWVCANLENNSSGGDKFCQLPTCQTGGDGESSEEE